MKPTAFVLMPFAAEFDEVYSFLIQDAVASAGFEVRRADDLISQNNILKDVITSIVQSDLIVADLTSANPNVYYELGIAHALNKPVILMTQDIGELPFDLRSYRVVSYGTHFAKMMIAKNELSAMAKEALLGKVPFGNPLSDFAPSSLPTSPQQRQFCPIEPEVEGERGFLDYIVNFEEGMEILGSIVEAVGHQLNQTTPEINLVGEKLNNPKELTNKQKRELVRNLAAHISNFGRFVKPKNNEYRTKIKEVEESLEYMLSGKIPLIEGEGLENFIKTLDGVERAAYEGRAGFTGLVEVMDSLPNVEREFDKAKKSMSSELRTFIANIDQTISMISRAKVAGKSLAIKVK